jgi:hypothetical protein
MKQALVAALPMRPLCCCARHQGPPMVRRTLAAQTVTQADGMPSELPAAP